MIVCSIRLMFSIVDIQTEQETDFEELEEGQEADEDEPVHSYPIRCSFNITKVRPFYHPTHAISLLIKMFVVSK